MSSVASLHNRHKESAANGYTAISAGCRLQPAVLCFDQFQDRNISIRILPQRQQIVVNAFRLRGITGERERSRQLQARQRDGQGGHLDVSLMNSALALLDAERLVGVVRSQSGAGSVYASWLGVTGHYGCAQPDLSDCKGLQGSACKHLLVLVLGLARAGQLPMAQALQWLKAAHGKRPRRDADLCADTLIQYKGAEAGELDWRPTETVPEDFYAF